MNITINELSVADLAAANTNNNINETVWNPDGISLTKRIEEDPNLYQEIQKFLGAEALMPYIVPVRIAAPTRCIDGRRVVGWNKMSDDEKAALLGPKLPGGTTTLLSPTESLTQPISIALLLAMTSDT